MIGQSHSRRHLTALLVYLFLGTALALALAQSARSAQPTQPAATITEFALPTPARFPTGMTAGPDGNLWFAEFGSNKIGRITPTGAVTEFDVLPVVSGTNLKNITAGPDGNLWFTDTVNGRIGRITPAGIITMFVTPTAGSDPEGITAGPDGNIWFAEHGSDKIGRITPAGTITEFALPASITRGPEGIAAGPDGNLWFTNSGDNQIGRITPAGVITLFAVPTALSFPRDIAAGPDGNLWFTEFSSNKIGRITPAGTITEFAVPTPSSSPWHITLGPDGNVWFTENSAGRIGQITPAGTFAEFVVPTAGSAPWGVTAGPDGNLWFTEFQANKIGRLDLASPPTATPTATPTPPTRTPSPTPPSSGTPTGTPARPTITPSPTPPSSGTPTSTPTPAGSPTPAPPRPKPAFVTVVQRPSPNIGARRGQIVSYTIVATNRGHGEAKNTTIDLPFDPAAVSVLDAQFSRPGAWVSALLTDSLVIKTGRLEPNGDVVTATVRLLVLTTASDGAQLGVRLTYTWYDHRSGGTGRSNLPIITQAGESIAQATYPLTVQWAADETISASSPIFAPGEPVAFWYHTPSGAVEAAGRITADDDGVARLHFKIAGSMKGNYSIVAYGLWTQFTAVGSIGGGP